MLHHMQKSDIVIVGAGLVGTSLAVALQNQGLRIAILEHHLPQTTMHVPRDIRPITLSLGSHQILHTLGVWNDLVDEVCPVSIVHVSEQGVLGSVRFRADELGVPALGYVVPFFRLQKILYQRATAQKDVEIITMNQIKSIQCGYENAVVHYVTVDGETRQLVADLLVGADGTRSIVRQFLNIAAKEENKNEIALVALLELEKPHHFTAYERFTSRGILAVLPLFHRHYCRLVWTMSKVKADEIEQWTDERFKEAVQIIFGHYLGNIKSAIRDKRYLLHLLLTKRQIQSHSILIGNAAHTFYPFTAQGFNLGLRDVAVLSEVLTTAHREKKPLGDIHLLQNYERWCKTDQNLAAGLARGISGWFGLQLPLINRLRGLGLLATELLFPFKKRLAKSAMGLVGRLPKLVRGLKLDDHDTVM